MPSISSSYAFVFLKEKDFLGGGGLGKTFLWEEGARGGRMVIIIIVIRGSTK